MAYGENHMSDLGEPFTFSKDRRRWWVALLMLFPSGAGYIYVGRPFRFVGFTAFVGLSLLAWYLQVSSWTSLVAGAAAIGFAVDVIVIALTQNSHSLRWPQRRNWYVVLLVLWSALLVALKTF